MMIRIIMLFSLLLISGVMIAQEKDGVPAQDKTDVESPVKLKKKKPLSSDTQEKPKDSAPSDVDKNKPESNPEKKKENITSPEKLMDHPRDNLEEEEIFGRIGKNLKDVDDRLGNLELGEATLQKQRDILEDIDKLLKKNQSNQSQANQSQSKSSSKSESQNKQSKSLPDNQDSSAKDSDKGQDKQKESGPKQGSQGAIPAIILIYIGFAQTPTWAKMKYIEIDTWFPVKYKGTNIESDLHVTVLGRQWEWRMRYPQGNIPADPQAWADLGNLNDLHVVNELHVWKDARVKIHLKTQDVIHSFFLPNLRLKQDALPGKIMPMWFQPIEANVRFNPKTTTS